MWPSNARVVLGGRPGKQYGVTTAYMDLWIARKFNVRSVTKALLKTKGLVLIADKDSKVRAQNARAVLVENQVTQSGASIVQEGLSRASRLDVRTAIRRRFRAMTPVIGAQRNRRRGQ